MGTHASTVFLPALTRSRRRVSAAAVAVAIMIVTSQTMSTSSAQAATTVGLGTADSYVVLGGQAVTNTGPSTLGGDLGVSPGSSITGFPPGIVVGGTTHTTDAHAMQAQIDLTTAYDSAAAQAPDATSPPDIGGQTLVAGVYTSTSTAGLTGTLTLDGQGDAGAVWVFQIGSALTTASASAVALTNGALACNVFRQVGSSATLGTGSVFVGTIMALTSVSVTTGATVEGRALARNGSVTLDNNVFTDPRCTTGEPGPETGTPGVTAVAGPGGPAALVEGVPADAGNGSDGLAESGVDSSALMVPAALAASAVAAGLVLIATRRRRVEDSM